MRLTIANVVLPVTSLAMLAGLGCMSSYVNPPPTARATTRVNPVVIGTTIRTDPAGNVIEMDLTGKLIGNGDLAAIARYQHLQNLWLSRTGVTDAGLVELQPMKRLRVLGLARTGITDAGLKHLAAIKSLREVHIWPTKVTSGAVDELKDALPGIRVIY